MNGMRVDQGAPGSLPARCQRPIAALMMSPGSVVKYGMPSILMPILPSMMNQNSVKSAWKWPSAVSGGTEPAALPRRMFEVKPSSQTNLPLYGFSEPLNYFM